MDQPGFPWFVYLAFPVATLLIVAFTLLLFWVMRRKPVAGVGPQVTVGPDGSSRLLGGSWLAMIHADSAFGAMGGTLGGVHGRLVLAEGVLSFVPDGSVEPLWSAPANQLAGSRGLARPVRLDGPMGTVHLTVSRERINRFSRNSLKDLRELGYAKELMAALAAYGARTS